MFDYTVTLENGTEVKFETLQEAKKFAADNKKLDPYIDRYSFTLGELDGRYWLYVDGHLTAR